MAIDRDQGDNTEEVENVSGMPARFEIDGMRVTLQPGERIRLHKNYTRKRKTSSNRDVTDAPIEQITGGRVRAVREDARVMPSIADGLEAFTNGNN